jgi:hypothetical protein
MFNVAPTFSAQGTFPFPTHPSSIASSIELGDLAQIALH